MEQVQKLDLRSISSPSSFLFSSTFFPASPIASALLVALVIISKREFAGRCSSSLNPLSCHSESAIAALKD